MKRYSLWILFVTLMVASALAADLPSNKIFTYQGRLLDDNTPADGLYTFHGAICFTNLDKGDQISAAINAAGIRYRADMTTAAGTEETVRASITLYLNEDDQVTLQGYVSAAAPPVNAFGNPGSTEVFTYFTGARVD